MVNRVNLSARPKTYTKGHQTIESELVMENFSTKL